MDSHIVIKLKCYTMFLLEIYIYYCSFVHTKNSKLDPFKID